MDWSGLGILFGGFALMLGAPALIAPRLRSASDINIVRPPSSAIYAGLMGLFAVPVFGTFDLLGNVLNRGPDQLIPWSALLIGFGGLGIVTLWLSFRYRMIIAGDRLIYQSRGKPDQIVEWADIIGLHFNSWTQNIRIQAREGRKFTVTIQDENIVRVLEDATLRNIPITGFDRSK